MNIELIKEKAEHSEEFLKSLCESENEEQIIHVCDEYGLDITNEEASELLQGFALAKESEIDDDEELSEESLEEVSGGLVIDTATVIAIGFGLYVLYRGGKWVGTVSAKGLDRLTSAVKKLLKKKKG